MRFLDREQLTGHSRCDLFKYWAARGLGGGIEASSSVKKTTPQKSVLRADIRMRALISGLLQERRVAQFATVAGRKFEPAAFNFKRFRVGRADRR
jgi:hypothetical protein